jgi:hypothetical protein
MRTLITIALLFVTSASFAQLFSSKYYPGIYYNNNGVQHNGFICINNAPTSWIVAHPDNIIYFKTDKDTVIQKVKMSTLRGFVVQYNESLVYDTFAVVHNSKSARIKYNNDMMEVLFNKGPIKLYDHALTRRGGVLMLLSPIYVDNYYFYGDNPDDAIEMRNKDFKDVMSKMLADDPEIVGKINNGIYKMNNMRIMLKEYYAMHPYLRN